MTTLSQVMRFLTNPHKPMILALSRPDPKKNITTLVKAFGECRPLRELANLVRNTEVHSYNFIATNVYNLYAQITSATMTTMQGYFSYL
jgi:hypothetical protein